MKRAVYLLVLITTTCLTASTWRETVNVGASVDCLYWARTNRSGTSTFGDTVAKGGPRFGRTIVTIPITVPKQAIGLRGEAWCQPRCSPFSLIGRYYWVQPHNSQRFTGTSDNILNPRPLTLRPSITVRYHAGDVLLAYNWCFWNRLHLSGLVGAHVLYLADDSGICRELGNPFRSDIRRFHRRIAGGGGAVGLAARSEMGCGLSAFAEARYAILVLSALNTDWLNSSGGTSNVILPNTVVIGSREFDLRAGVDYSLHWRSYCAGLRAGWEQRSYLDGLGSIGGPFAGVVISF